jgi:hypothetical protein
MNLDGGRTGGVDLDGGCAVETHVEEERGERREPRRWARGWCGPRRWHALEAHTEEEQGVGVEAVNATSSRHGG